MKVKHVVKFKTDGDVYNVVCSNWVKEKGVIILQDIEHTNDVSDEYNEKDILCCVFKEEDLISIITYKVEEEEETNEGSEEE